MAVKDDPEKHWQPKNSSSHFETIFVPTKMLFVWHLAFILNVVIACVLELLFKWFVVTISRYHGLVCHYKFSDVNGGIIQIFLSIFTIFFSILIMAYICISLAVFRIFILYSHIIWMIPSILCCPRRGWENFIFRLELYLSFFSFSTNSKAAENIDFFLRALIIWYGIRCQDLSLGRTL